MITTPIHKTNILPLRWFINSVLHPIAYFFLMRSLKFYFRYEEDYDRDENFQIPRLDGYRMRTYSLLYKIINKPYDKWGTVYKIDMDAWKKELDQMKTDMSGPEWDDYDADGIPYWKRTDE